MSGGATARRSAPLDFERGIGEFFDDDGGWADLAVPWIRRLLLIGIGLGVFQQFTGINSIMYYGSQLLEDAGFSAEAAIRAYTHGSSYAVGQERDKGTLSVGKLADLVTLSDDLLSNGPTQERAERLKERLLDHPAVINTSITLWNALHGHAPDDVTKTLLRRLGGLLHE